MFNPFTKPPIAMMTVQESPKTTRLFQPQLPAEGSAFLPAKRPAFSLRLLPFGEEKIALLYLTKSLISWEILGSNKIVLHFNEEEVLTLRISGRYLIAELTASVTGEYASMTYECEQPIKRFQEIVWEEQVLWVSMK